MTLSQLQAFVLSAKLRTFSAAATHMKITQPGLSDLIARLETELSTKLFHRTKKILTITAAGEQLLPFAEQAVNAAAQGAQAVQSMMSLGGGTATFGVLRNADFYLGINLAKQFHTLYPNVRIRLIGQNSAEVASNVASGYLEAGLVALPIDDTSLDVVPLARDEILYITTDNKRVQTPRSIQDLSEVPLVLYDAHYALTDPVRRQLNERARVEGIRLNPIIEVEYLSTALALVAEGIGDSVACRAAIMSDNFPKNIHAVPFAQPLYETLALIKRKGQLLSPATRELARLAHESLITYQGNAAKTTELLPSMSKTTSFFLG